MLQTNGLNSRGIWKEHSTTADRADHMKIKKKEFTAIQNKIQNPR